MKSSTCRTAHTWKNMIRGSRLDVSLFSHVGKAIRDIWLVYIGLRTKVYSAAFQCVYNKRFFGLLYDHFHQVSSPKLLFFRCKISCQVSSFSFCQSLLLKPLEIRLIHRRAFGLWGCGENHQFIRATEHFFLVYIGSSKHLKGWENSRKICKSIPRRRLLFA